jgi:hypothetical protein
MQERVEGNFKMINYSIGVLSELERSQQILTEICSVIMRTKHSYLNNSDNKVFECLCSWETIIGWLKYSKVGKIGRDQ